jgi:hypothetical protein
VTIETLEKVYWKILPHCASSPDLVLSNFCPFSPISEALGGKIFRANDEIKLFCNSGWMSNLKLFFKRGIMKLPKQWQWCIEVQEECVEK